MIKLKIKIQWLIRDFISFMKSKLGLYNKFNIRPYNEIDLKNARAEFDKNNNYHYIRLRERIIKTPSQNQINLSNKIFQRRRSSDSTEPSLEDKWENCDAKEKLKDVKKDLIPYSIKTVQAIHKLTYKNKIKKRSL